MSADTKKSKSRRTNNILLISLLATIIVVLAAFGLNIFKIAAKDAPVSTPDTVEETPENEFVNEYYSIGHNATEINKEYFVELDNALDAHDKKAVSEAVTKCFITEYYTWINKDGNYDIGGMQYIYTDRQRDFETYTRSTFYRDMDLYITQLGRENLLEVAEVTVNSVTPTDWQNEAGETITDYIVNASWTYVPHTMSAEGVQTSGDFYITDHNGRMEVYYIQ